MQSTEKLKDLKLLYQAYNDYILNQDSDTNKALGSKTDNETIRINRLRILSMAIEFQSLKVQTLGGIVMPLDMLLVDDNRTSEDTSKGVKAMIEKYTEISESCELSDWSNSNSSRRNFFNDLITAYNSTATDESKKITVTHEKDLNLNNSSYMKWFKETYGDDKMKTLTEAFDLIDTWSRSPWKCK